MTTNDISNINSEAGIIATLIQHPDFVFYSEQLLPNHFTDKSNRCIYTALTGLAEKNVSTVDPYIILEYLNSTEATRSMASKITLEMLNELVEMSDSLARHSPADYKILVDNVLDCAFRRDMLQRLKSCEALCYDCDKDTIQQKIYNTIDEVMTEYSTTNDIPQFKDIVDECWEEIKSRQIDGYAGIPFKFPTLNDYATIERGELFIFAAEAKQGKSIMLLNCAVDLLKRDLSVLYLDSELNSRLHLARLVSHLTGIEYKRITSGAYNAEEEEEMAAAREWLKTRRYTHMYVPMFDQQSIYTIIKRVNHEQKLDVVIVDYFKGSGSGDAWDSYAELGRLVDMIKNNIAGDMGIGAIGAAQATPTGKIADSAKICRNASTIALLQNKTPEEIEEDGEECGNKKLRILFNRNGMQHAPGEYIDLNFDGNRILFEEAKQHIPQVPF